MKSPDRIVFLLSFLFAFSCNENSKNKTETSPQSEYTSLDYFREYYGIKQPAKTKIRKWNDSEEGTHGISYYLDQVRNGLTVVQDKDERLVVIKDYINSASEQTVVLNGWMQFSKNQEIDFEKSAFAYAYYENNQMHLFYSPFFKDTAAIDIRLANDSILSIPLDPNVHHFDFPISIPPFCNTSDTVKYTGKLKSWHELEDGMWQAYNVLFECHCK